MSRKAEPVREEMRWPPRQRMISLGLGTGNDTNTDSFEVRCHAPGCVGTAIIPAAAAKPVSRRIVNGATYLDLSDLSAAACAQIAPPSWVIVNQRCYCPLHHPNPNRSSHA